MINGINEINIHFGLKINQNKMNAINVIMMKANPNPIKEMGHHFLGSR